MANNTTPKKIMAKLLQLSRPSRRVRDVVRTWWSVHLQQRRRKRATTTAPTPPVPLLSLVGQVWDQTQSGYSDVTLGWTFDHAGLPAGFFDVQVSPGPNGTDWEDIGTVGSGERSFYHECAYSGQSGVTYRVRYRHGVTSGDWSAGFNVDFDD